MKNNIKKLGELINNSEKILLINHIRMDMDAFGSLCGMYDILRQLGKDVKAVNDEPPLDSYSITGYNHIIETNAVFPLLNKEGFREWSPNLIISFDAASLGQLGVTYKNNIELFKNTSFVVLDHHKTNPGFGSINIINTTYSSTCELSFDILKQLDLTSYITPKIATSLLSGIYTDTNIYYNSNTTSNTLRVAAELIDAGADFRKPYYEFYKKKTYSGSKLWGKVLNENMKKSEDGKIVWASIKNTIFKETNSNERELTGLISEFFANIDGVEICFISHELDNGNVKTSFRSSEQYDVSAIAAKFGGGGHKQAAGFTSEKNLGEVEKMILEEIDKII